MVSKPVTNTIRLPFGVKCLFVIAFPFGFCLRRWMSGNKEMMGPRERERYLMSRMEELRAKEQDLKRDLEFERARYQALLNIQRKGGKRL